MVRRCPDFQEEAITFTNAEENHNDMIAFEPEELPAPVVPKYRQTCRNIGRS
jgi:hypothetical protein